MFLFNIPSCKPTEIGPVRKRFIFIIGFIENLMFGGIGCGWAQIVFVLKSNNVYGYLCHRIIDYDTRHEQNTTTYSAMEGCNEQDEMFAFIYTIASSCYTLPMIFFGYIIFYIGPVVSKLIANACIVSGFFFIGLTTSETPSYVIIGMILLSAGGSQLILTNFSLADLFPEYRSTALSLLSGVYTASAGIFLFVQLAHDRGVSMQTSCWFMAGIMLFFVPFTFLMPRGQDKQKILDSNDNDCKDYSPISKSIKTLQYLLFNFWYNVCVIAITLFCNYYNTWITSISTSQDEAWYYSTSYSLVQFACPFFPPLLGLITDFIIKRTKTDDPDVNKLRSIKSLSPAIFLTTLALITMYSSMLFHQRIAVYVGLLFLCICRACISGCGFSSIKIRFPVEHFDRLIGLAGTISSITILLQYPLFLLVLSYYYVAHGLIVTLSFLILIYPIYLLFSSPSIKPLAKHSFWADQDKISKVVVVVHKQYSGS